MKRDVLACVDANATGPKGPASVSRHATELCAQPARAGRIMREHAPHHSARTGGLWSACLRLVRTFCLWVPIATACSLVVDTEVDAGCAPDKKVCPEGCVSITEPKFGCGSSNCDRCPLYDFKRAMAYCDAAGECALEACQEGYADCSAADGCETHILTNPEHCGECDEKCNADEYCDNGDCELRPQASQ